MDLTLSITADDLGPAFKAWADYQAEARGKTSQEIVRRVMQYWVSFAMSRIPEGDKAKVERQLMALTTGYSRAATGMMGASSNLRSHRMKRALKSKMMDRYRGTVAASIVAILNYKGARGMSRAGDRAGFYALVSRFVSRRKFATGLHRVGGFWPALNLLGRGRGAPGGRGVRLSGPKYSQPPGMVAEKLTGSLAEILVENWASAAQRPGRPAVFGIARLSPDAFTAALPEIQKLLLEWVIKDGLLTDAAKKAGLREVAFSSPSFGRRAS